MADRVKPMGMDRALISKMGAKYDSGLEYEVRGWIKALIGEDIGEGPSNVEKSLRDGVILCTLMKKVIDGTPSESLPAACAKTDLKPSPSELPFKQMENIEKFLKAAHKYGVPNTSLFQTVELYEARNLPMVLATISHVGTEAQRLNFNGETIGSKPTVKHDVNFSYEQLKQSCGLIGLQSGTNKFASQKGMRIGAVRHIADIRADKFDKESEGQISLQSGTNKFASQKGMTSMGAVRHICDIRADEYDPESNREINLQSGTNKFDSQAGMRGFGAIRHIADVKVNELDREGSAVLRPDMGYAGGDSQKGMTCFGAQRHVTNIKTTDLAEEYAEKYGKPATQRLAQTEEVPEDNE
uniref:Transgelin n=1 Tax=Mytilus coruscus TaxID=42192 RepID=A0A0K0YB09_MYTCO|nr:calponin-like protein-2 [Mytilus coruscus]